MMRLFYFLVIQLVQIKIYQILVRNEKKNHQDCVDLTLIKGNQHRQRGFSKQRKKCMPPNCRPRGCAAPNGSGLYQEWAVETKFLEIRQTKFFWVYLCIISLKKKIEILRSCGKCPPFDLYLTPLAENSKNQNVKYCKIGPDYPKQTMYRCFSAVIELRNSIKPSKIPKNVKNIDFGGAD